MLLLLWCRHSGSGGAPLSRCSPGSAASTHTHSVLLLADHAPQYARCARRPLPAMARSRSSSPAATRRHSSRGNKIAQPAILRFAAGQGCGSVVAALKDRHQGRDGRGLGNSKQEITMAQIGTFTRAEDGSYTGTIKTLSLNIKALNAVAGSVVVGAVGFS